MLHEHIWAYLPKRGVNLLIKLVFYVWLSPFRVNGAFHSICIATATAFPSVTLKLRVCVLTKLEESPACLETAFLHWVIIPTVWDLILEKTPVLLFWRIQVVLQSCVILCENTALNVCNFFFPLADLFSLWFASILCQCVQSDCCPSAHPRVPNQVLHAF